MSLHYAFEPGFRLFLYGEVFIKTFPLLSGLILLSLMAGAPAGDLSCRVTAVLDGDTADCYDGREKYRIRLNHIDAPEKSQPFGRASKRNLSDMIYGKTVTAEIEGQDRYGRYLGVIYIDGVNVNVRQTEDGMAWAYRSASTGKEYVFGEMFARDRRLGLWQDPFPEYPGDFRKRNRK